MREIPHNRRVTTPDESHAPTDETTILQAMPMVVLVAYSFNDGNRAQIWQGFSVRWFYQAFANDDIQNAALNTLIIAVCATVFATVMATLAALVLARSGEFKGKNVSLGLITLPLVVPEIATAVATLSFFAIIQKLVHFF